MVMADFKTSNYDDIQKNVVDFGSQALYVLGFDQVDVDMPVLNSVSTTRFFGLFLGLILNIIIFILLLLSILLIYSLLMINVETRTFELGVLRMLGVMRQGVVELLLLQALSYALPSIAFGLSISQLLCMLVVSAFENLTGIPLNPKLTSESIGLGVLLGLAVPIVASVIPIRTALGQNLQDSLDVKRSKTKAVKIDIERAETSRFSISIVILGVFLGGFGFGVRNASRTTK
jgi:ABC-type antimicrobial peptide transport system permease subunit